MLLDDETPHASRFCQFSHFEYIIATPVVAGAKAIRIKVGVHINRANQRWVSCLGQGLHCRKEAACKQANARKQGDGAGNGSGYSHGFLLLLLFPVLPGCLPTASVESMIIALKLPGYSCQPQAHVTVLKFREKNTTRGHHAQTCHMPAPVMCNIHSAASPDICTG
jgi:hypothetical protein